MSISVFDLFSGGAILTFENNEECLVSKPKNKEDIDKYLNILEKTFPGYFIKQFPNEVNPRVFVPRNAIPPHFQMDMQNFISTNITKTLSANGLPTGQKIHLEKETTLTICPEQIQKHPCYHPNSDIDKTLLTSQPGSFIIRPNGSIDKNLIQNDLHFYTIVYKEISGGITKDIILAKKKGDKFLFYVPETENGNLLLKDGKIQVKSNGILPYVFYSLEGLLDNYFADSLIKQQQTNRICSPAMPQLDLSWALSEMFVLHLWNYLEINTVNQTCLSFHDVHHRFNDIFCPSETAVKVNDKYLHANFVGKNISDQLFIASQAPEVFEYPVFWQGIIENSSKIIDLTGRGTYYPLNVGETHKHGDITVTCTDHDNANTRSYTVLNTKTNQFKMVTIHKCAYWPDGGVVDISKLKELVSILNENISEIPWIHCQAGIGRTGTLITAWILHNKINKGEITQENLEFSLIEIILQLRSHRGSSFVQNDKQFDLLREFGWHLLRGCLKS